LPGARIAEQEIGERVAAPLAVEGEGAAGCVRIHRIERQMKQVAAELQAMRAAIDEEVVVELDAAIVARHERRRIADRAEQSAERHLRIAEVERVGRHAMESRRLRERHTLVRTLLTAGRLQPAETELVED